MATHGGMNINERLEIYYYSLQADTPMCINCKHFYRHYTEYGRAMECGHCAYARVKWKKTYDTCENFERKCKYPKSECRNT